MMGRSFLLMAVMALALGSNASYALAEQAHENHSGQHIPLLGEEHAPAHAINSAEMQEEATLHIIDEEHGAEAHGERKAAHERVARRHCREHRSGHRGIGEPVPDADHHRRQCAGDR